MSTESRILLIVSGGIAAYKSLELIRRLRQRRIAVSCVLTRGGEQFVTPLSLSALSENKVYSDIFSLTDEAEMGHIQLSRSADLLVVAPATADILARMASGLASDLATTVLLATDKPVMFAPAMNIRMWEHAATQANIKTLVERGLIQIGPDTGDMACGEYGLGRMAEPMTIVDAIDDFFAGSVARPLTGRRALITSGPTREAIDPVRYLSNYSSGKQGHAIAAALAGLGAETTLITGPVDLPDPDGVQVVRVESADDMMAACQTSLPADVAVCAAAVSDWRVADRALEKLKKDGEGPPFLKLTENPDILKSLSQAKNRRPGLVVGFAAETEKVLEHAVEKRYRKGCDWMLANDVSPGTGTFGGESNRIHFVHADGVEDWPLLTKQEVAARLADRIAAHLGSSE
ncbi:MAG: bifunctional phosphopantothenoylcysteine decarboxylase/phosphopantothenate--cysteine ligase CoaBC [Pseudomonadota bacterium]|nr:bifunctional phosphopantothenoylcysteine decarboxylase/phosphopantothenate--cysteine ligase CoaBC [Pseudomonadota bacterium]